jgi:transposase
MKERALSGRVIFDRFRVERFFNRIKQCRRIATRYDRLAANYLAFVQLASIRLWLRVNE